MANEAKNDISSFAKSVKIIELPSGKDVSDWSGSKTEFEKLIRPKWSSPKFRITLKKIFDLSNHIDRESNFHKLCSQIASQTSLPISTVILVGLSTFSSMSCRRYCVQYEFGGILPIGIYAVAEQPPGAAKSWCINSFQKPFFHFYERIQTEKEKPVLFVTNATPEALENTLNNSMGFFAAVSSEQGLMNSLLGKLYGDTGKSQNNDLLLSGFDGGWFSAHRITRKAYQGYVSGAICCFAQPGTIEALLDAKSGVGIADRFLMISEPHSLGKRDHNRKIYIDDSVNAWYKQACSFISSVIYNPQIKENLAKLKITESGHKLINDYRNKIEPEIADNGKYSHASFRGLVGKINMHILKIAANLSLLNGQSDVISDDIIKSSIGFVNDLLVHAYEICEEKLLIGDNSNESSVLEYFEATNKTAIKRRLIINALRFRKPFSTCSGNKIDFINLTLDKMCKKGVLSYAKNTYTIL